jgi:hypothetical protein
MNEYSAIIERYDGTNEVLGEKPTPVVTLSTTHPMWTDLRSNQGLHHERPVTNTCHGRAYLNLKNVGK